MPRVEYSSLKKSQERISVKFNDRKWHINDNQTALKKLHGKQVGFDILVFKRFFKIPYPAKH